ncbi:MAG TPA: homoserine kinase [Pyrodictium sp.]|nr:homoserine kinase [Pyrodictium sp.]
MKVFARGEVPSGEANVAYHAAINMLNDLGEAIELEITVEKGVPVGVGLGSSGATAAATVYAINVLLGEVLSREELVRYAGLGEAIVAGEPHYDNVAASLLGGLTLVYDVNKAVIEKIEWPQSYRIVVFKPKRNILRVSEEAPKTKAMREVLPKHVPRERVVEVARKALLFKYYASLGEWSQAFNVLNNGWEIEASRSKLIPGYNVAKEAALRAGAKAFNIAGAGPAIFAIAEEDSVEDIVQGVNTILSQTWGEYEVKVVNVDNIGARVV